MDFTSEKQNETETPKTETPEMNIELPQGEPWSGKLDRMPAEYPDRKIFAKPTLHFLGYAGEAVIEIYGLVDHACWLECAELIRKAIATLHRLQSCFVRLLA